MSRISKNQQQPISISRNGQWTLSTGSKLAVYARQSTKGQVKHNTESADYQTTEMLQLAQRVGGTEETIILYIENRREDGTVHRASGRLRIDQREGLQALVERIQAGEVKAVLVFMLDRLFRDEEAIQYNTFISICKKYDCVVVTPEYGYGYKVYNFHNRDDVAQFRRKMEEAANYIEDVVKGRMLMLKDRKAMRGEYVGTSVPLGFLPDSTGKYIIYEPHAQIIRWIFKRFRELDGQFYELGKELRRLPYIFPDFESWVAIPHVSLTKVEGGYHIASRNGLRSILTNLAYIGYWVWKGEVVSKDNHPSIVDESDFWYAWDRLSDVTIDGEEKEKIAAPRTRYSQEGTTETEALLRQVITSPNAPVYVHDGKFYAITDNRAFVHTAYKRNIEIDKLDHIFLSRLFETIGHTQKGETIREKLARAQKQKSQEATSIEEQLGEIEPSINAYQANLELPPDVLDTPKRIEYAQKLTKLRATQTQLIAKLRVIQEDVDTEQDIKEYEDVLNGIRKTLDGFSYEKKLKFVRLVAKSVSIEEVSPRWLKIEVVWRGAYAGIDTGFIWCTYGSHNLYTDEEQRVLIALYATASKQVVLNRLRTRSWNSVTHQAKAMGLSRVAQYDDFRMDKGLCMDDVKFMESIGLVYNSAWPNMQPFWYNDKTRQSTDGHHGTTIP